MIWQTFVNETFRLIYIISLKSESCIVVSTSLWPHGLYGPWNSGQNTGVGSLSLLQGIFPTQGSNPVFPYCRQILYLLSHNRIPYTSFSSVQFSSVIQYCPTLCDPMNHSTTGLPVHHQLPESTETHVNRVGDAIQPSRLLSSTSLPALNLSQNQGLFKWVILLHHDYKMESSLKMSFTYTLEWVYISNTLL